MKPFGSLMVTPMSRWRAPVASFGAPQKAPQRSTVARTPTSHPARADDIRKATLTTNKGLHCLMHALRCCSPLSASLDTSAIVLQAGFLGCHVSVKPRNR